MRKGTKIKTRISGDFNAPWLEVIYLIKKGIYFLIFSDGRIEENIGIPGKKPKYRTLRKTVSINLHKWKDRKNTLNEALKKDKKIGLYHKFWWAKFWRKGKTLRKLCIDLKDVPDLDNYSISNKQRSTDIINSINQAEDYYRKFDFLFQDTDPLLGYQIDKFTDFSKEYSKKERRTYKEIPHRFIMYFQ